LINNLPVPSFTEEDSLAAQGYCHIAGVDEVGRGALAGPVVAAAVILPHQVKAPWVDLVRDSKVLRPARREFLFHHIQGVAIAIGVAAVSHKVIDARGIVGATMLAMKRAVGQLSPPAESLLIDYVHLSGVKLPQKSLVGGDQRCFSIACASIVAKVSRDRMMVDFDKTYPGYRLGRHKGYGTREHLDCLCRLGPSPIHRRSFRPVGNVLSR